MNFQDWVTDTDETLEELYDREQKSEVTGDVMIHTDRQHEEARGLKVEHMFYRLKLLAGQTSIQNAHLAGTPRRRAKSEVLEPEYHNGDQSRDQNHNDGDEQTHPQRSPQASRPQQYPGDGLWG